MGELAYRLEPRAPGEGGGVRYRLEPAAEPGARPLVAPPGGLVFTLPAGRAARALVDGRPADPGPDGRLVVRTVPATVELLPAEPGAAAGAREEER